MENKEHLVDIIIPVYNGAKFITAAVDSIQKQSWRSWRLIIVDDGSTDNTVAIVRELMKVDDRITLHQQTHQGISATVNTALQYAHAHFIAFLDADDLWHEHKLEKQMDYLQKYPSAHICFTMMQEFDDIIVEEGLAKFKARSLPMKGYSKSAFLSQRNVFEKYGNFSADIALGDFIEWFSRVTRDDQSNTIILDEVLTYRRIHDTNTTRGMDKKAYLNILKSHLDEKRKIESGRKLE